MCISLFSWIRYWLSYMILNSWKCHNVARIIKTRFLNVGTKASNGVNCCRSLDRFKSPEGILHPILTEVTLEQPINNISPSIFIAYHDLPRGLVVRIRRSHRRGPGSIPGVGIASLFGKSNIRDLQVGLRVRD